MWMDLPVDELIEPPLEVMLPDVDDLHEFVPYDSENWLDPDYLDYLEGRLGGVEVRPLPPGPLDPEALRREFEEDLIRNGFYYLPRAGELAGLWRDNWRAEARVERILRQWNMWHGGMKEDPAKGKHDRKPDHFTKPKKPKRERPLKVEGLSAYDPTHGYSKRAEGRRKKQFKNKGRGGGGGKKNCNMVR